MKKTVLLSLLIFTFILPVIGQVQKDIDRAELKDLLDDRKKKFDSYSLSLEKHSGIFGNKTKNDVNKSKEVLIDIVKTDNRIISTLYRVVDFRTYEKVNMNYDIKRNDDVLNSLRHATDTLSKQVEVLKSTNHDLQAKATRLKWFLYGLCVLTLWIIFVNWRKRRTVANSNQ